MLGDRGLLKQSNLKIEVESILISVTFRLFHHQPIFTAHGSTEDLTEPSFIKLMSML